MNIRLDIEYDGAPFHGWQRQLEAPTIQAHIEDILERTLGKRTVVYGASRTDSGVHAQGQVANFYAESPIPPERWCDILNFYLPPEIRVRRAAEVPAAFHAQKHAVSKVYEYRILNGPTASALDRRVLYYPGSLDWAKIRECLPRFVGEKDFRGFQGAGASVQTTVRRVISFDLFEEPGGIFRFRIEGTGFLKQMVRAIVGTLLEVGEGKRTLAEVDAVFEARDRRMAGRTAPPWGLCLMSIRYLPPSEP